MIRVLQIVSSMDIGGIQAFIMNVYRNIDRNKVQFDFLLSMSKKGMYDEEIIKLGGRIYRVPNRREGIYKNRKKLNEFFKIHKYNCVHYHASSPSYMEPLIYAKKNGVREIILHSHSTMGPNTIIHKFVRAMYRSQIRNIANNYFACSKTAAKWMYGNYISDDKIQIIPNAIKTEDFKFKNELRLKIREELNINEEFVVGHIGRFAEVKNHDFLIDIFKKFNELYSDSVLLLVGDGELREKMEKKCCKLGLKEKVLFTGIRTDISSLLQAMDVFVMPSKFEGLPISLIEAQATGLPCVISDSITREVELTEIIKYVLLSEKTDEWIKQIEQTPHNYERRIYNKIIENSQFNIDKICSMLIEKYI